ncbi:MAG: phytanoyl-CoA dioxygenase (PhyH) superfamily [SAR86 cluster bacterium SAR86B]|uniref:Phytanoyl-CoA dioxygenase (PhyH) superfamily n=1 Tax=SAR86 cluster bacterium SAR86B TaxID=1123867 RepID=J5KA99_9GAMM|nr:MAG: phytanoyl-CoA dioxygenase (PhyH) superfamily [SAR86 cluster bacterium SAR86B]
MNINQLANSFHLNGYVYIENFFDRNLMDLYQNKILDHFALDSSYKHDNDFIKKSDTDVIPWFPQIDGEKAFDVIEQDERLINLTEAILGPRWKSLYCMVMYSNKSSNGQAWHQDCDPSDNNIFNLNRLIYTMDINKQSGGEVELIPGSHKKGIIPALSEGDNLKGGITIEPKNGSLLMLHGHLWHKVLPINQTIRVSTNYRCIPNGVPDNITDTCVYRNMLYRFSDEKIIEERI